MTDNNVAYTIRRMSPIMTRALRKLAGGTYDMHGREKASLVHRGLITDDLIITDLGEDVLDHMEAQK